MAQVGLAAVMVFEAFVVRGMSRFGAGIIAIPLLVFIMPIYTAVPMMGLIVFVLFIVLAIRDRRGVIRDELCWRR